MGRNCHLEWSAAAPTRDDAPAPATPPPADVEGVSSGLGRGDGLIGQQVVQTGGADDRDACAHGLRLEILNDKRAVVVGNEADVMGGVQADEHITAQEIADLIE